jgi:hypothetical protein
MRVAGERDAAIRRYTSAAGGCDETVEGLSPELTIVREVNRVKRSEGNVS